MSVYALDLRFLLLRPKFHWVLGFVHRPTFCEKAGSNIIKIGSQQVEDACNDDTYTFFSSIRQ